MNKQLLIDTVSFIQLDKQKLEESKRHPDGSPLLINDVLLQESDVENQNGRVYPHEYLFRETQKYQKLIDESQAYGELDHPNSDIVSLQKASHRVTGLRWKGNQLFGDIMIIPTGMGRQVEAILKSGGKVGLSSRSLGSIKNINEEESGKNIDQVQNDLELLCWDIVSVPSVKGADMRLQEGLSHLTTNKNYDHSSITELINEIVTWKETQK